MIDMLSEQVFLLSEIPAHLIPGKGGKPVHRSTIDSWSKDGRRKIKLETIMVGGKRATSAEALARFYTAVTNAKNGYEGRPTGQALVRTARQRSAAVKDAVESLKQAGA